MDLEIIKDIIWSFCNDLLNIDVIRADQTGARPESSPYLTYKILSGPLAIGFDDERIGDANAESVTLSTTGQRDFTISFNSYGELAGNLMVKLQTLLRTNKGREKLLILGRDNGISLAFIDAPTMQDLTSLIQSEYEERFQMDAVFRAVSIYDEEVPFIEDAEIDGDIKNQVGEIIAP